MSEPGGGPINFVVAAKNAARDVVSDQARTAAAKAGAALHPPEGAPALTRQLCIAIKAVLEVMPDLPPGSRAPAGDALKHLARTLDISARLFSIAAGEAAMPQPDDPGTELLPAGAPSSARARAEIDPDNIPYKPGVDARGLE